MHAIAESPVNPSFPDCGSIVGSVHDHVGNEQEPHAYFVPRLAVRALRLEVASALRLADAARRERHREFKPGIPASCARGRFGAALPHTQSGAQPDPPVRIFELPRVAGRGRSA